MSNPWKDYSQNFRNNLPAGVTYREDIARYFFNDKRFILPNDVTRYKNYLEKFGFEYEPAVLFAEALVIQPEKLFSPDVLFAEALVIQPE